MSSGRPRNYDRESGMDRVKPRKSKKVTYVSESEEDFSSEEEVPVRIAKKKILKKDFKEDARRPRARRPSPPSSEDEDEVVGNAPTTKQSGTADTSSAATAGTPVAPHMVLLSVMDKVGFVRPVHHALNTFTVNCSVMFTLLHGLQMSMSGNTRINNYFGEFLSLGTRIYYAYLVYYQILRAKLAANVPLDAIERRVYRKLETTLPLESCPVAGPLVGWFQSLGAYKPDDKVYNWAYPVTQTFNATHTLFNYESDAYFYPPIPAMVAMFNTLARIPSNYAQYCNQSGYIVPVRNVNNAAATWLGQTWQLDQATASGIAIICNFNRPGLSLPLPEQVSYLNASRITAWRRIGVPQVNQSQSTANLEYYLLCDGVNNLNWLRTFRNWANAEARFAKGSVNLSQISPQTGAHVLCLTEYTNPDTAPTDHTEPWTTGSDDFHRDLSFTTRTTSASVDDAAISRAHTYRIVSEVTGVGNRLPSLYSSYQGEVEGPLYRYEAANGTYTGNLRNRWKHEATPEVGFDSDLSDIINIHLYSPMGEDAEPVRVI
jgi:hypothetical protein